MDYSSDLEQIVLKPLALAINDRDLSDALSDQGAHLTVHEYTPLDSSDDEADDGLGNEVAYKNFDSSPQVKSEIIQKEYMSIVLNAHKDPKMHDRQDGADLKGLYDFDIDTEENYRKIHRLYAKLDKFGEILAKPDNGFTEVAVGVYQKKTQSGHGPAIKEDSFVIFNAAFWLESATDPFDSSWLRRNAFVINLATESVIPGLTALLLAMKQDEWCEGLITDPSLAYGRLGCPPRIPPNSSIFAVIQVVNVLNPDKVNKFTTNLAPANASVITFEEYYAAANEARERGNYFYVRSMYKVALDRYKSGIRILLGYKYKSEEEDNKGKNLLLRLYNNSAKCFNALLRPRQALSICRMAEDIDKNDPKLLYNLVRAWAIKGHYDKALGRCRYALQVVQTPQIRKTFEKELDFLKAKLMQDEEEIKNLHTLMGKSLLSA